MNQKGLPNTEYLELMGRHTAVAFEGSIMVSTPDNIKNYTNLEITVGSVGCDNKSQGLYVGDFMRYDAGKKGKFEVRLLQTSFGKDNSTGVARLSVTKLE